MQKRDGVAKSAAESRGDAAAPAARAAEIEALVPPGAERPHELHLLRTRLDMQGETLRQCRIALEESRHRNIDFHDFAPGGYITLTDDGLIAEINLAGADMLGADRAMLLQSRFGQFVAAEDVDRWHRHFMGARNENAESACEVVLLRPDGSRIDVRLDSRRRTNGAEPPLLRVVVTDITERKRAEEALKASEQRFRDIVDTTDGIVWEADAATFNFTFVSKQAERLLGYPREDWLKPGFWVENLHPEDKAWAPDYCASCTQHLAPHDFEYRFIARDGRTVWLHDIVTVVAEAGRPRWLRGIMVDVTRRKQTEEKLREMATDLEAEVAERTMQLRTLSAQLTMTEERERRLLAQDLHDNLGQLLAVIKIKLTSLVADSLPASISQVVELVARAELSARMITMQLSPPILHTLGFVPALEWLIDEMERTYGIVVHLYSEHAPQPLVAEMQAMLYRSVRELLINVARHAGVVSASLYCHCDGSQLTLVVSDDGCGFDPAGFRDAASGQGAFGLNSINERVTNVGGAMEIDSSPGNGTTVTLTVPCAIAAQVQPS